MAQAPEKTDAVDRLLSRPLLFNSFWTFAEDESLNLLFTLYNRSDKTVSGFSAAVFLFDSNGDPVAEQYYPMHHNDLALAPGAKTVRFGVQLPVLANVQGRVHSVVVVLNNVLFSDGDTWKDPQAASLLRKYLKYPLEYTDPHRIPRQK